MPGCGENAESKCQPLKTRFSLFRRGQKTLWRTCTSNEPPPEASTRSRSLPSRRDLFVSHAASFPTQLGSSPESAWNPKQSISCHTAVESLHHAEAFINTKDCWGAPGVTLEYHGASVQVGPYEDGVLVFGPLRGIISISVGIISVYKDLPVYALICRTRTDASDEGGAPWTTSP